MQNPAAGAAIATVEIELQLNAIQAATGWVVTAIDRIGDTIRRVSELSHPVTHAVMKQRSANDEMNRSIHEAAVATRDGTQSISSVSNAVRETGNAAEQLLDAADEPSRMAVLLRSEIDRILVVICTV
ncbi:MAG: hypothetical protein H7305_13910 [Gemmatimonadaceae bacterium]|nr:hypothetical protein [Gemmatimonadaceae bacterium]